MIAPSAGGRYPSELQGRIVMYSYLDRSVGICDSFSEQGISRFRSSYPDFALKLSLKIKFVGS